MTEYVVSRLALDTLEESGYIGLSSFEADGYHMILHDALVDEDDNPGDGWQWNCETWEYPLREIVRCRDCKHATISSLGYIKYCEMFVLPDADGYGADPQVNLPLDFFCAYGELRGDA